jgi:hypothetical protein
MLLNCIRLFYLARVEFGEPQKRRFPGSYQRRHYKTTQTQRRRFSDFKEKFLFFTFSRFKLIFALFFAFVSSLPLNLESILPNFVLRKTKIFFRFLLLCLAILMYRQYFPVLQTLKLNNENLKNKEIKVL